MVARKRYSKSDLIKALGVVGLKRGDVVFSHIALLQLGIPLELADGIDAYQVLWDALQEVLGPEGTFLTPAFSYSFCNEETYDPSFSPSRVGPFSSRFLKESGVVRSLDPIFSVAGHGPLAEKLFEDLPKDCFGVDCLFDRLGKSEAKICQIGLDLFWATCVHFLEQECNVPHRYKKFFSGTIVENGVAREECWIYNVRILDDKSRPRVDRAQKMAEFLGLIAQEKVGCGHVHN